MRALHPHIGARLALADGSLLGVQRGARCAAASAPAAEAPPAGEGAVGPTGASGCLSGTARGALRAARGQPPARDGRPMEARSRRYHARTCPLRVDGAARVCAYAVLRRVFEDGAYADRALHAEARELDAARPRAGDAPRLRRGAAQGHARPPDRASRRAPHQRNWTRRCWRRCGWGCMSCCISAARPTTRSWPTRSSSPRAARAAVTGSSTPCCAGARARAAALLGGAERCHARAGRDQALPSRVDRAAVVAGARRRATPAR